MTLLVVAVVGTISALVASCGGGGRPSAGPGGTTALRLGFFPNITHATALVGVREGIFARELGPAVTLEPKTFTAGPSAVEAIFSGALDAAYLGPTPAVTAYVRSHGKAIRIVSGAASGGAFLVVRPDVASVVDLAGRKVASPQLGGSQDVALRSWLKTQGLRTNIYGGGDVSIVPQDNALTLQTFRSGAIAGAWVPEPWATRLVLEGGGKVLVDERSLWPGGGYATTQLVVSTRYLEAHRDIVRRLLVGHVTADALVHADPARAQRAANDEIAAVAGKRLSAAVLAASWKHLTFTNDPIGPSLRTVAAEAVGLGLLDGALVERAPLDGIYDLSLLDEVLRARGEPPVDPG